MNLEFKETYRDFDDDAVARVIEYENDGYVLTVEYPFGQNPTDRIITCRPKPGTCLYKMLVCDTGEVLVSDAALTTINLNRLDKILSRLQVARDCAEQIKALMKRGIPKP